MGAYHEVVYFVGGVPLIGAVYWVCASQWGSL